MFKVICDGKHLIFFNKMDQHIIAHNFETNVDQMWRKHFTTLLYLKSKCQTSFIYWGIQLWNNIPNHFKQISNVRKFKKYMKSYTFAHWSWYMNPHIRSDLYALWVKCVIESGFLSIVYAFSVSITVAFITNIP